MIIKRKQTKAVSEMKANDRAKPIVDNFYFR